MRSLLFLLWASAKVLKQIQPVLCREETRQLIQHPIYFTLLHEHTFWGQFISFLHQVVCHPCVTQY